LKCNKQAKKQKNQSSFAEINLNGRITKLNGKRERERERERETWRGLSLEKWKKRGIQGPQQVGGGGGDRNIDGCGLW